MFRDDFLELLAILLRVAGEIIELVSWCEIVGVGEIYFARLSF